MRIEQFVEKAIRQDKRNIFSLYNGVLINIPLEFQEF